MPREADVSFRGSLRHALADPLGGSMARHFAIPAVTAIVADGEFGEPDRIALSELTEAMVRAGVPRGRMFVLLTGEAAPDEARRARARELRGLLGMPVIAHDPAQAGFTPGRAADGVALSLDDELREAESVVVCGPLGADRGGIVRGGPAALLPGLADGPTRAALEASLAALTEPAARARAAFAMALAATEHVAIDFALVWNAGDPPAVKAGAGRAVFEACEAAGWLAPPAAAGAPAGRA